MKLARALLLLTPMLLLLPATSHAQAAYNYLNAHCVWDPSIQEYSITIHRFPGQTLEHTIVDQSITSAACTSDPLDLMNWLQRDLQNNGTWIISLQPNGSWGPSNDQVDTKDDVFCPDVNGVEYPSSIGSMMGTVYPQTYSGGNVQTALALNYTCPSTPQSPPGPGGPPPVTASYAWSLCNNGKVVGAVAPGDNESIQMINLGSNGSGADDWQTNFMDHSGPTQPSMHPTGTPHCNFSMRGQVSAYLGNNMSNVASAMLNSHHIECGGQDVMQVYVDSCEERGDDSAYGYQVACCPAPQVTHGTSEGANCHSMCLPISVSDVTHFYGPTWPVYTDPATVCNDLVADTAAWMNTSSPGGPGMPWICGPNWGVAAGGWYVPNSLNMTCNVVSPQDPSCLGGARVDVCLNYRCER